MKLLYFLFFALLVNIFFINNVEGLSAEKIRGGRLAVTGRQRYMVALIYKPNQTSYVNPCAGAIIDKLHIITVAHCFYDKQLRKFINKIFYAVLSAYNLNYESVSTRYVQIDYVVIPDCYNFDDLDSYSTIGDLAIAKLSESLDLEKNRSILASLKIAKRPIANSHQTLRVSGYGWNTAKILINSTDEFSIDLVSGHSDGKLRNIDVKILSLEDCIRAVGHHPAPGNMCGRAIRVNPDEPSGICQGDSGGPLVHPVTGILYGVAVNGFMSCDENEMPAIYILIIQYSFFIENVLNYNTVEGMLIFQLQEILPGRHKFNRIPELIKDYHQHQYVKI